MKHFILTLFLITVSNTLMAYDAEIDGIYYNFSGDEAEVTYKEETSKAPYYSSDYSGSIEIPGSVSYKGKKYTVNSIGNYAFNKCDAITSITIPESVTEIGAGAFYGCQSLTSIIIPTNIENIKSNTFAFCLNLKTVSVPMGVTTIGVNAFLYCSSVTTINLPASVTDIMGGAFEGCSSLTSITIPEGVPYIYDGLFLNCSSLTSVNIPESVTWIGNNSFAKCSSLTTINIPKGVTIICEDAFRECSSLASIVCTSPVPTRCKSGAFDGVDKQNCKLYVPKGCEEAYRNAGEWKDFYIVEMGAGIESLTPSPSPREKGTVYDLSGRKINFQFSTFNSQFIRKGIYIQNGRKVAIK